MLGSVEFRGHSQRQQKPLGCKIEVGIRSKHKFRGDRASGTVKIGEILILGGGRSGDRQL